MYYNPHKQNVLDFNSKLYIAKYLETTQDEMLNQTQVFDKPVKYSELLEKYKTREKIAEVLKDRCNELGRLDHTQFNK